ncbi:MAG: hypothetical protein ACO34C_00915 [Candidatus Kapaibacteriota bacterium]
MWKKDNNITKKRRGAEIYFVLYLSALILLLPGKQEDKADNALATITSIFQQSFSLLPEKNTLLCKMTTDSTGMPVLQLDTSNIMLITGNVQDVSLECIVEDQDKGSIVQVGSTPGSNFTITYDSLKQLVFFSWHPPSSMLTSLNESKTYAVTVKAKAKPLISGKNSDLQQLLLDSDPTLMAEAKFSISILAEKSGNAPARIVYTPTEQNLAELIGKLQLQNRFQIPETFKQLLDFNTDASIIDPSKNLMIVPLDKEDLSLTAALTTVKAPPMETWNANVIVQGVLATANYEGKPRIELKQNSDEQGTAFIEEVKAGQLSIKGRAPAFSPMKVKVFVQRKSDKKIVSTEFDVIPENFPEPRYPQEIRPGDSIFIKTNINSEPGMSVTATIVDENGKILKQSNSSAFYFYLKNSRNITRIFLERRVNGNLIGDRYPIEVVKDAPSMVDVVSTSAYIDITVKTCGRFNGNPNRSKIIVKDGTGKNIKKPFELYAAFIQLKQDCSRQTFRIEPREEDEPFSAIIYFMDSEGLVSNEFQVEFPQ